MTNDRRYPHVHIGNNVQIGDFVIIGIPPKGKRAGELLTVIGDNSVIRSHTVIYAGTTIGAHFQSGHHVTIREKSEIGSHVSIGTGSCVEHNVTIENNVRVHSQVFIPEYSHLKQDSWIGPNVVFTNAKYPNATNTKARLKGAIVEEFAKIGANATILPSVTVGAHSLVGAGAVVVKDVPERKIVAGNPARILKSIDQVACYQQKSES